MSGESPIQFRGLRGSGSLLGHSRRLRFMDSLVESGRISPSLLRTYIDYQPEKGPDFFGRSSTVFGGGVGGPASSSESAC